MFTTYRLFSLITLSTLGATLVGCAKEPAPAPPAAAETAVEESSPSDVQPAFADLPEADRAAAMAQKVCPVSDEALGGMGTPIKVTVNGRDVFICCESCREKLERNPDEYLAKLDAK